MHYLYFCSQKGIPIPLKGIKLNFTKHIVSQIHQSNNSCCPFYSYTLDVHFIHTHFHKTKYVFHTRAYPWFLTIVVFLLVCQRIVSTSFFADLIFHFLWSYYFLLRYSTIGGISIKLLTFVFIIQQQGSCLRITNACIRDFITCYQLTFGVLFYMIFISKVTDIVFLCPAGICILLALLMWVFLKTFRNFSTFYLLVLITTVSLTSNSLWFRP